jgi:glycosyltransferase involved in cell wall biosynthesis
MICAAFPPTGGAGVQRSAKFAKYLPQFGWRPIVWTCGPLADLPQDDSLLCDLPEVLDVRTHSFGDAGGWLTGTRRLAENTLGLLDLNGDFRRSVQWRVDRATRGIVSQLVPDLLALWALTSLHKLRRVIVRERVDVIYSTFSPASNHLLGWLLKRATRRPWVSDYRDLWTEDCWYPFAAGPQWRRAADRYLERRFLEDADVVIGVSEPQTRILATRVLGRERKFRTIPNGFDPDDFERAQIDRDSAPEVGTPVGVRKFVLAHVGRFSWERVRPEMIEGFRRFVRGLNDERDRFELRIVGWMSPELGSKLDAADVRYVTRGQVPHHQAISEMMRADALLLQYPDERNADTAISGKLFEYFAANRPVLMIGPRSSVTRQLVESFKAGLGADPDANSVCAALGELWRQWQAGALQSHCDPRRLHRCTRRNLTGELAALLVAVAPPTRRNATGRGKTAPIR